MTRPEDHKLVDYLYGELSEEEAGGFERLLEDDADLGDEVEGLGDTLEMMRALEVETPPSYLSSKVMAAARQAAEEAQSKSFFGRLRKMMWGPVGGLVGAGAVAVVLAVVATPQMLSRSAPKSADQSAFELAAREAAEAPAVRDDPAARAAPAPAAHPAEADDDLRQERAAARGARPELESEPEPEADPGKPSFADAPAPDSVAPKAKPAKRAPARRSRAASPREFAKDERADEVGGGDTVGELKSVASGGAGASTKGSATKADRGVAGARPNPAPAPPAEEPAAGAAMDEDLGDALAATPPRPADAEKPRSSVSIEGTVTRSQASGAPAPTQPAEPAPAPGRAAAQTRAPATPATEPAPARAPAAAVKKAPPTPAAMQRLAEELIRAAGEDRKRGELASARRVLDHAATRVAGYPALGWVYLARARMEHELGVRAVALRYARAAAAVPGFDGRQDAIRLVNRLEREAAPQLDLAPAAAPPPP